MLTRLRYLNKLNKIHIRQFSSNDNIKNNKYYDKNIDKIMDDVKIIKSKYKDIREYNLIKFLLNYKSFDKKYNVNIIINEINELNKTLNLSNSQVLDIIISLKQTDYINTKNTEKTIEALSFIGIIFGVSVILTTF